MASKTKIPYIALSYCWGKAQFLKLTTSNLQACKNGILINSLPNVFQHAIAIARGLGVYGIWIDALCIIQDDLGDWEIEASKMANVYQNSVLVLAMTSAANPDEDCLGGYFNVSIDNINARLIHHPPHTGWPTSNAFPLAKRGWTFQERLLAPRIVYFGPHELSWECQTYRNCECGRDSGFEPFINDFNTALRRSDPEEVAVLWRALIQQYTTLQFTFESDRLPALSGIVATIQLSRSGTYLAGLWSDTLILDMLWFVDEDEREKPNLSESRLVSPTWSWASIAVPVTYSTAKSSFYDLHIESQVAAFNCEPAGLSMSGRIKSGWVRLESSTLFCRQATSSGVSKFKVIMPGTEKEMGDFEASLIFDRQPNSPDFKFLMVRMASWRSIRYEHDEEQTLLIRPVSVEGNFERIGFAVRGVSHPRLPWPEERSIITIV
ncbi:HET-domain-containing protein [Venturia nashicola]|uniref:HET-domain-containing protein n=1 Tax=Venturia nashicola TaxID=86259 RepID=A0A4Z1NIF1_9PEZI|nr:HET-domain-containing protein [Venturia nashicola]